MTDDLKSKFIITGVLGERQYQYLIKRASEAQIRLVLDNLGNKKPFPLNVLKELKIKIDETEINKCDEETADNHLDEMNKILGKRRKYKK